MKIIAAPSNLGLRPLRPGHVPGTWRAPSRLLELGLVESLGGCPVHHLGRPNYSPDPPAGTRLLNGPEIRRFNLELSKIVGRNWENGDFSLVIGGDCSILLGCLAGIRRTTPVSLVHIDGHSDFRHPGNYDADKEIGAAAGMDLALATGRGEAPISDWPGISGPLVPDHRIIQLGERESRDADFAYPDIERTSINRIEVFEANEVGHENTFKTIKNQLNNNANEPVWIHLDVDVFDESIMPAVDCPGSPGLSPEFVVYICSQLLRSESCCGMTVSIYDPDLDPTGIYGQMIVELLGVMFNALNAQ